MMQKKVSMIMPCYNSAPYLDKMLESILNQSYDSIELIAAYDASTDDTLEKLNSWRSKFDSRGFALKIVENAERLGITGGINKALPHFTGDFITFPDSDDEMLPDFVKTMVNALEEHPKYNWARCDNIMVFEKDMEKIVEHTKSYDTRYDALGGAICLLLYLIPRSPWRMMARADFFRKVFPKSAIFQHPSSHEVPIALPLAAAEEFYHVSQPLYKYILHPAGYVNSRHKSLHSSVPYLDSMEAVAADCIERLPINKETKQRYFLANRLYYFSQKAYYAMLHGQAGLALDYADMLISAMKDFSKDLNIPKDFNALLYWRQFFRYTAKIAVGIYTDTEDDRNLWNQLRSGKRVVLYGAGKNCGDILAVLNDLAIEVEEIWDINADGISSKNGVPVKTPPPAIDGGTTVVITILKDDVSRSVAENLHNAGCGNVMNNAEILPALRYGMMQKYFPNMVAKPLVSVLMPIYNAADTLNRAMDSILNQTYKNIVVVVVEDGCTDGSVPLLNDYAARDSRVKIYPNGENLGVARSLNRGIELCEGKYIARMDADDYSYPERIEKQVAFMEANPDVSVLGAFRQIIYPTHNVIEPRPCNNEEIHVEMLFNIFAAHPTIMLRAEPFHKNKDWRYPITPVEDYDLFASLCFKVKFANLPEALVDYYKSDNQATSMNLQATRASNLNTSKTTIKRELGIETDHLPNGYFGMRCVDNQPYDLHEHLLGAARFFCDIEQANIRLHRFDDEALRTILVKQWGHIKNLCRFKDITMTYKEAATGDLGAAMKSLMESEHLVGNVIIYGTGSYAESVIPILAGKVSFTILAYSDTNPAKHGADFLGKKIISPAEISGFDYDYVLIAAPIYEEEIRENLLLHWNVPKEKIHSFTTTTDIIFHHDREEFNRYYAHEDSVNKAYLFVAPDYGNLGDHAIAHAERIFFAERLGIELAEIGVNHHKMCAEIAKRNIQAGDLVLITGGGFLGSLWPNTEQMSRQVVEQYPNNPIVILPQTLYWENTKRSHIEAERTRAIYESHKNLTICARDHVSYTLVREYYPNCRVILVPDMVLSRHWDEFFEQSAMRKDALLCLKQDKESILNDEDKSRLVRIGERLCGVTSVTDTYRKERIQLPERLALLQLKLNEFRSASLCITDRLHGVIFSAIAGTPCVALSNCNHKLRESTKMLEYLPYIRFANNIEEIELAAHKVMSVENPRFDNSELAGYFEELENLLRGIKNHSIRESKL